MPTQGTNASQTSEIEQPTGRLKDRIDLQELARTLIAENQEALSILAEHERAEQAEAQAPEVTPR